MALSYMGIDLKPVDFTKGSIDTEGLDGSIVYTKGVRKREYTYSPTWSTFSNYYSKYVNDNAQGNVSPVILYTDYLGNEHWLVVIGQDDTDTDYFWVLDSANGKHSQIKFVEIDGALRIADYRYKDSKSGAWRYDGYPANKYSSEYEMYRLIQFSK